MINFKAFAISVAVATLFSIQSIHSQSVTQSLDGTSWLIDGFNSDKSKSISLIGTVPGMVHPDLQREGLIPDPFWRDNFKLCQWPEFWSWTYKRTFDVAPDMLSKQWIQLQFDGIDTYSEIYLNGRKLGTTNNMFLPYQFNVNGWLKEKGNTLEVRLQPLEKMVGEKARLRQFKGAFGDPYRAYVRRMQCTFGWDWVPRFITYGVWRPVRIVGYDNTRIDDIFIYTKELKKNTAQMALEVTATTIIKEDQKARITCYDPQNKPVWNTSEPIGDEPLKIHFEIKDPQIWWSNGLGEHPIYRIHVELFDSKGKLIHQKSIETGVRTVAVEEIKDKEGNGSSFTVILNGKRVYIKGGNWVPADPFPARITKNQYATLLKQAQDAGVNMLRVWGGGIFEPQEFWDLCNRMGILASQDFMLACGGYPDDDKDFVSLYKREVEANVKLIRSNPALVFWCGDNELGLNKKPSDEWSCKLMNQNVIAPMMAKLDPSRPFRITSPLGIDPETTNSLISGDSHVNSFLSREFKSNNFDLSNYRQVISKYSAGRFMSEQTTAGSPPKSVLRKFMNDEDLLGSEMYEYHDIDNPGAAGHRTLFSHMEYLAEQLYGDPNGDNDRRIRQMEYIQHEFVRLGLEGSRRRKFYSSGIQFWMYNDCWPALGWSLIDYWGGRKAGWYGFAAGSRPVIAASEQTDKTINWWISNDLAEDIEAKVRIFIQPVAEKAFNIKHFNLRLKANESTKINELDLAELKSKLATNAILVCEVETAKGNDRSYWTPARPQDVNYEPVNLRVIREQTYESGIVTITADKWARVVTLEGDVEFEDNYFELLPGETRTIKWKAKTIPYNEEIKVSCWNQLK
ncbi:MAG: glycoside hydrolase family 2 protein [Paludibacter sp.]|jgi:beta-mannosidase|nr:glycoside hydrolase family 2 protein [Paludibacter sp.]